MSQPSPALAAAEEIYQLNGWQGDAGGRRAEIAELSRIIARHCQPRPCACCAELREIPRRCAPFLVHALCTIPSHHREYSEAEALLKEINTLCYPEVDAAFAADAKRQALAAYDSTKPA